MKTNNSLNMLRSINKTKIHSKNSSVLSNLPTISIINSHPLYSIPSQRNISKIKKIFHSAKKMNFERPKKYKYKISDKINMVAKLNFEADLNDLIETETEVLKEKDKIDSNKKIKLIRLGLNKKYEEENENNAASAMEKEQESKNDKDKMNNKENQKKIEFNFKQGLKNLEKIKKECQLLNFKINDISTKIYENDLEINVLDNYAQSLDSQMTAKGSEDKNDAIENFESKKFSKKEQFEKYNKYLAIKQQRDERKKILKENNEKLDEDRNKLELELNEKIKVSNTAKKKLYLMRKNLINIYHLNLYEGIDFHGDGLINIIKDIWNLGVNVDINYMPTYLDNECIEYLFNKAKHSIDISKIRQLIKDNEQELVNELQSWRNSMGGSFKLKLNDQDLSSDSKSFEDEKSGEILNEEGLFKTKITDNNFSSYLNQYPKTKEFMSDYKKKHPNVIFEDDDENFKPKKKNDNVNKVNFKSWNIPLKIIEQKNKIEKLRYMLEKKIKEGKILEKKQIQRLNKEFINNNYGEKYHVCIEVLLGALCGEEKKNEMVVYFLRLEKENKDGRKIIQFHSNFMRPLKK